MCERKDTGVGERKTGVREKERDRGGRERKNKRDSGWERLLDVFPLAHKIQKNNVFFTVSRGRTDDLSLFKGFLQNCGRAGISLISF